MSDVLVVMTTFGDEGSAGRVARELVEKGLVACVNLVPGAKSVYRWKGEICEEGEVVALMKTTREGFERLKVELPELHPYEEPEVLALEVAGGSEGYLAFVRGGVGG